MPRELLKCALQIIDGTVDLLEGVRTICRLRFETERPEDPVFHAFRAIESETETFPSLGSRHLYSEEYLQRLDREKHDYLEIIRDDIVEECRALIRRFTLD